MQIKRVFYYIGGLLIAVPFMFGLLMSNYSFYLWVIRGPYPFSLMGSGPRMMWYSLFFFFSGLVFLFIGKIISLISKTKSSHSGMKKILMLFFPLFFLLPYSVSAADVSLCNKYVGDTNSFASCLLQQDKEYSLCFNRDFNLNKSEENQCVASYIKNKGDVDLCNNLLSKKTRDDLTLNELYPRSEKLEVCLMKYAVDRNDAAVCNATIMDSLCLGEFALKNNDYNFCLQARNIYDGLPEKLCFTHVALRRNDLAVCDEITKPVYEIARAAANREDCITALMVKNDNVSGCDKLSGRSNCLSEIAQVRRAGNIVVNQPVLTYFEKAFKWWSIASVLIFVLLVSLFRKKDVQEFHIPIFLILCAPFLAFFRVLYESKSYSNLLVAGGDANLHSFILLFYFCLVLHSLFVIFKSGYNFWLSRDIKWRQYRSVFFVYLFVFDYLLFTIPAFSHSVVDNLLNKSGAKVLSSIIFSEYFLQSVVLGSYLLFFGGLIVGVYWYRSFKKKKELNIETRYVSLVPAILLIVAGSISTFFTIFWWLGGNFSM